MMKVLRAGQFGIDIVCDVITGQKGDDIITRKGILEIHSKHQIKELKDAIAKYEEFGK